LDFETTLSLDNIHLHNIKAKDALTHFSLHVEHSFAQARPKTVVYQFTTCPAVTHTCSVVGT
jgi:hypothetical protein